MSNFIKRGMSIVLAVLMFLSTGVPAFAEEVPSEIILEEETELLNASSEESLEEIIRPQIEAYAKSIDKVNANKDAQDALINHGMWGNGKKISVGENHVLTATLMNSELAKSYLADALAEMVRISKDLKIEKTYSISLIAWLIRKEYVYHLYIYDYNFIPEKWHGDNYLTYLNGTDYVKKFSSLQNIFFPKTFNNYDKTLELIAGGIDADLNIDVCKIEEDRIIYNVNTIFYDTFDFDTENESTLENILGFIGLLLFNPYKWEAKCSFQIEVPNNCEHSYESVVKAPTCTEKGSATHTCTLCGYSYTEETAATGHSLGEWSVYAEPTVGKAGEERRSCANCDYYESKEIAAYRYGDVNCDGKVNTIDANYVRRYAAGLLTLDERQLLAADVDGENGINVIDASLIRRYTVKLINAFPKEAAE